MPKKIVEENYRRAWQIMFGEWVQVNTSESHEVKREIVLASNFPNPEKLLLKKESYEKLSNEAKEIIQTVLDCPQEIFDFLYVPHFKRMTKRKIRIYFRAAWRSKFFADHAIDEVTKWVNQL